MSKKRAVTKTSADDSGPLQPDISVTQPNPVTVPSASDWLRARLDAPTFKPFSIRLRDGRTLAVHRRHQIAISSTGVNFAVVSEGENFEFHGSTGIAEVQWLPVPPPAPPGWELIETTPALDELCRQISNLGEIGWFFRGESRFHASRTASMGRYLAPTAPNPIEAECQEIRAFRSRSHPHLKQAERDLVRDDIIGLLTLMQHHHAPTRLLDWTSSPWVAAYHAAAFDSDDDGLVWAFSPSSFGRMRPREWSTFEAKLGKAKTVTGYCTILRSLPPELVLPFALIEATERMLAQGGTFTFGHPANIDHTLIIGRHIEPGGAKTLTIPHWLKRPLFERMRAMNLTAASLFPGLDGVGMTTAETMRLALRTPRLFSEARQAVGKSRPRSPRTSENVASAASKSPAS